MLHVNDVLRRKSSADGLSWNSDSVGAQQKEAIEDLLEVGASLNSGLNLLTVDFSLLLSLVGNSVLVLHLGTFLSYLDKRIQILNFQGKMGPVGLILISFHRACSSLRGWFILLVLRSWHCDSL